MHESASARPPAVASPPDTPSRTESPAHAYRQARSSLPETRSSTLAPTIRTKGTAMYFNSPDLNADLAPIGRRNSAARRPQRLRRESRRQRRPSPSSPTTCGHDAPGRGVLGLPGTVATMSAPSAQRPDRNLAMELVRVTESAALAAARWVGRGNKDGADGPPSTPCARSCRTVPMDGIVVIGEGEKDEAPMLFNGEKVGDGTSPQVDVAVDPIDGTTLTANGARQRPVGDRRQRAGHDVRSRPVVLHGEDRRRARRRRRRSTSPPAPRRTCAGSPRRSGRASATSRS